MTRKIVNMNGGVRVMTEEEGDYAHAIYMKVCEDFDEVLRRHLGKEEELICDYVETKILDEYRPWNYRK